MSVLNYTPLLCQKFGHGGINVIAKNLLLINSYLKLQTLFILEMITNFLGRFGIELLNQLF